MIFFDSKTSKNNQKQLFIQRINNNNFRRYHFVYKCFIFKNSLNKN